MTKPYRPVALRFWDKVDVREKDECWLWKGAQIEGYGHLVMAGHKKKLAHRASWEIEYGFPMPHYLQACHHCDVKLCVNPRHIYAGTQSQNMKDHWDRVRPHGHKTHCPHGHPYEGKNLYERLTLKGLDRRCRTCNRERNRKVHA